MYEDEFEETLAPDEADTLAYEALWRKKRPTVPRAPPAVSHEAAYAATSAAWQAGKRRSTEGLITRHTKKRDKLSQHLSKLEASIPILEQEIADAIRVREEQDKIAAVAVAELDTFKF